MLLVALAALLVGTALAALVVVMLSPRTKPAVGVARSLQLIDGRRSLASTEYVPTALQPASERVWQPLARWFGRVGRRLTPVGTPARLARRLDLAGNPAGWDVERLFIAKGAGTLLLGGFGLALLLLAPSMLSFVFAAGMLALGYWLVDLLVYNVGLKRQEQLQRAAPDAIDMLTICVEAGLGFDAGLAQVARNTTGPLAGEFARMLQEMQIGRSREEAFTDLAERTDVPEIQHLVTALVQADRLGVPVASVLREQSAEMRVRRRQRAEEQAQKVGVKIVFPVVLCIFPVLFVVVIGPGVIQIARTFAGL